MKKLHKIFIGLLILTLIVWGCWMSLGINQSSDSNTLKVVGTGQVTVTKAAGQSQGSTTIQHNLGYLPILLVVNGNGSSYSEALPFMQAVSSSGLVVSFTRARATTTDLQFIVHTPDISPAPEDEYAETVNYQFNYILLQQVGI